MARLLLTNRFPGQIKMDIPPGEYRLGDVETVYLSGEYEIDSISNFEVVEYEVDENIKDQLIYDVGKVLFRTETDEIHNLIYLFIRYTHDPCEDEELDFSIKEEKRIFVGKKCTKKKVLFANSGKVFVAFGKYIFGFENYGCESLKRINTVIPEVAVKSDANDNDDEEEEKIDLLDINEIMLHGPPDKERRRPRDDCYYSFMIYDKETSVLDAFGLYC